MMISKAHLKLFVKKQKEINKLQHELNNAFRKYKVELTKKAMSVLSWKDDNLGQSFLRNKRAASLHELRDNCLVLCCYYHDYDPELPKCYFNVSYDEIFSDDWKAPALEAYQEKLREKEESARATEEKKREEKEVWERAEYERLKAKFEK